MNFLADTNVDFIGKRRIALVLSLLMIGVGLASLVMHGGPRYSIDFTGGSLVQVQQCHKRAGWQLVGIIHHHDWQPPL